MAVEAAPTYQPLTTTAAHPSLPLVASPLATTRAPDAQPRTHPRHTPAAQFPRTQPPQAATTARVAPGEARAGFATRFAHSCCYPLPSPPHTGPPALPGLGETAPSEVSALHVHFQGGVHSRIQNSSFPLIRLYVCRTSTQLCQSSTRWLTSTLATLCLAHPRCRRAKMKPGNVWKSHVRWLCTARAVEHCWHGLVQHQRAPRHRGECVRACGRNVLATQPRFTAISSGCHAGVRADECAACSGRGGLLVVGGGLLMHQVKVRHMQAGQGRRSRQLCKAL